MPRPGRTIVNSKQEKSLGAASEYARKNTSVSNPFFFLFLSPCTSADSPRTLGISSHIFVSLAFIPTSIISYEEPTALPLSVHSLSLRTTCLPKGFTEMKFGKRLKKQIEETLPEWRNKFLSYKDLKKLVRKISTAPSGSVAEAELVRLLDAEVEKLNAFFIEKEEDFVICQKLLQERIQSVSAALGLGGTRPSEAEYNEEMRRIRKDIVNLHGEMVLLENYSNINYTGLAKILKKYDKRTGGLLRLPFIEKVLKQPFFTTDLISKLVKECETTMDAAFSNTQEQAGPEERDTMVAAEQSIYRNTVAALVTMQELIKGSSTYSHFSLPQSSPPISIL